VKEKFSSTSSKPPSSAIAITQFPVSTLNSTLEITFIVTFLLVPKGFLFGYGISVTEPVKLKTPALGELGPRVKVKFG
jgi:hypothetical protein